MQIFLKLISYLSNNLDALSFLSLKIIVSRTDTLKSKHRKSLYSVEFGPPVDTIRSRSRDDLANHADIPKPMTPRRIKRRSVMNRGTTNRASQQSRRSHNSRSSTRSSRRKTHHQNPVTKIMEQQEQPKPSSKSYLNRPSTSASSVAGNSDLTVSNLKSLNNDYIAAPGPSSTRSDFRHSPDPIYYNMAPHTHQAVPWNSQNPQPTLQGHSNPTYQHSTPNLSHSPEPTDEPYTNRPPSVRSSYSNFHGSRPLSSYNPSTATKENNIFLGLTQQQQPHQPKPQQTLHHQHLHQSQQPMPQQQIQNRNQLVTQPQISPQSIISVQSQMAHQARISPLHRQSPQPPPVFPKPYAHVQPQSQPQPPQINQAIPQVPLKQRQQMSVSRESMSSLAFLNGGPPAYNLNYHTPPDSETTM